MIGTALRQFLYLFKIWSCYLVFVYLPYEMIYYIDSYMLSMTALEIAVNAAAILVILILIGAIIALITSPPSLLLSVLINKFSKFDCRTANPGKKPQCGPGFLTHYAVLFLCCFLFTKHVLYWAGKFTSHSQAVLVALFLSAVMLWRFRSDFYGRATRLVEFLTRRVLAYVLVIAVIMTGFQVGTGFIRHLREVRNEPALTEAGSTKGKLNIILITCDALTAHDMSLYGYNLKTTPNIAAFANEFSVFENAISSSNWTRPTVGSLMTGKYPDRHRLINMGLSHNLNIHPEESLSAILKANGYRTAAISSNWSHGHPSALGLSKYFDINKIDGIASENISIFECVEMFLCVNGYKLSDKTGVKSLLWMSNWFYGFKEYWHSEAMSLIFKPNILPYYPPDLVLDGARQILTDTNSTKPIFLWTHILVPHSPYLTAEPIKGTFRGDSTEFQDDRSQSQFIGKSYTAEQQPNIDRLRLYYDENILYADNAVGRYLQMLKQSGRFDDSIIIISADHGESFSHGYQGHAGALLYQPLVHIPLLIHLPGKGNGRRIAASVSQTDVAPTILDLVGYRVPDWIEGRSLKDALGGKPLADKPVFTMDLEGNPMRGKLVKGHAAVVYGGYKYILSGELYHLGDDPEETMNLSEREPEKVKVMSQMLRDRFTQSQK